MKESIFLCKKRKNEREVREGEGERDKRRDTAKKEKKKRSEEKGIHLRPSLSSVDETAVEMCSFV